MRFLALASILALSACAIEGESAYEVALPTADTSAMERAEVCPAIAILCIEGYQPVSLPNCRQICVPDNGAERECDTDLDCPDIYCITEPCPQYECVGHTCRM